MTSNASHLATRYARRPLLLTPDAALDLARRLRAVDGEAFARPNRLQALLSRLGRRSDASAARTDGAKAFDDEAFPPPAPLEQRLAYSPMWAGEIEDVGFCWSLYEGVALMQVDTPIAAHGEEYCGYVYHGYDTLLAGMRDAIADQRVKAIFLRLETPGGVVSGGLPQLTAFMRENNAAAGGKPIWVYADLMASAGFWVGSPADRIWASRYGLVGSVGAVWVHEDWSAADAKAGLVVTSIQFGDKKTDGADWKPLSPTAKTDLQAEIDQCGRDFVADVVLNRPQMTAEGLIATQAGVFMAQHDDPARSGLALGFVDEIGTEEEAFAALLAEIAEPSAAATAPTKPSAAPAARASASAAPKPSKEPPMSVKKPESPLVAGAKALARSAAASSPLMAAATAAVGAEKGATDGSETDPAEAIEPQYVEPGDETNDPDPDAPVNPDPMGDGDEEDKRPEAVKIAASAEARTHAHLANAAVASGMTYAQFKGQVAALANAPKTAQLDRVMAGARRLGPDGPASADATAKSGAPTLGSLLVQDAKAKRDAAAAVGRRP